MITSRLGAALALIAAAAPIACATADASGDHVNPEVPLWYHRPTGAMEVFVHRQLTANSQTFGEDYERGRGAIDHKNGRLFMGSADHGFYALRTGDGSSIWRFETLGVVQCEPLYDEAHDVVFFGSHDGAVYAVRALDGALLWRFTTGAEVSRKPVLRGDIVYVANGADQLYALDRTTGKQRWVVKRTPALGMEVSGYAGPAVDGDSVFFAFSDGHVASYGALDGQERWTPVDLSAEAEESTGDAPRYLDVDTTPVIDTIAPLPAGASSANGSAPVNVPTRTVFVAGYAGGVYALDAQSGTRLWGNDKAIGVTDLVMWYEPAHLPNPNGPDRGGPEVPAQRALLASSAVSGLWALDPTTGRALWRRPVPEGGITAPVQIAGALLVGTTRYGLFLLSPRNGRAIDGFDLGSGFAQTPVAYGDRAYVMSNAGTLIGLQIISPK